MRGASEEIGGDKLSVHLVESAGWFKPTSQLDCLDLVVDFVVECVKVANQVVFDEGLGWLLVARNRLLQLVVQLAPFVVQGGSLFNVLLHAELLALCRLHLEGLFESIWVNLFQDGLEGNQGLLQDLVPMVLGEAGDDGHEHGEGFVLVGLQDVQEVVVLEEAHGAVSNLQVVTTNRLDDTFK